MRDLDRIKSTKPFSVDRQKISIIFATGIVVGVAIFAVGLFIGLRKPSDAQAATTDPLDELIASSASDAQEPVEGTEGTPAPLRYHDVLAEKATAEPEASPAAEDIDAPMPVNPEVSPIPMPEKDWTGVAGAFKVPAIPSQAAFKEPPRIELPKPGQKGVFTVHVSSFTDKAAAAGYVKQLRQNGYKAFLVEAESENRGTLYRVRIGPFHSHKQAWKFAKKFEKKEGIPTYVVKRVIEDD